MENSNNIIIKYYSDEDTAVRCLGSKLRLLPAATRRQKKHLEASFDSPIIACELLTHSKRDSLQAEDRPCFCLVFEKGEPIYELVLFKWSPLSDSPEEHLKLRLTDEKVFEVKHVNSQ